MPVWPSPVSATIPATWVPWPYSSRPAPFGPVKSTDAMTRPLIAACAAIPESMIATPIPRPVTPTSPSIPLCAWSAPVDWVVTAISRWTGTSPAMCDTSKSRLSASSCPPVTSITAPPAIRFFRRAP